MNTLNVLRASNEKMALAINETFEFNPPEDKRGYKITILVDDSSSWIVKWALLLKDKLIPFHNVQMCFSKEKVGCGDFAFLLGCTKIIPKEILVQNKRNLVIHESALPFGRGWSPMAWQVLEGRNEIPVVMFDAREELDSGPIYLRDVIKLNGTELLSEIRCKQGVKTVEMVLRFLSMWPELKPVKQSGSASFYARRRSEDDILDVNKTISENFDHLRIVDNEKYPAWFVFRGKKYIVKIYDCDSES